MPSTASMSTEKSRRRGTDDVLRAEDVGLPLVHAEGGRQVDDHLARLDEGARQQIDHFVAAGAAQDVLHRHADERAQRLAQRRLVGIGIDVQLARRGQRLQRARRGPVRVLVRIELHDPFRRQPEPLRQHVERHDGHVGLHATHVRGDQRFDVHGYDHANAWCRGRSSDRPAGGSKDPPLRTHRYNRATHSCATTARGSRVRYRVLWMAFLLAIITFLDRVCISIAAPYMMDDLGLTMVQMSLVFSAFTLAYSLFEVPSGWLGDVLGPRRVLTRIVLWWSAFTMLTGAAQGNRSLLAIRFLFGAGEAGRLSQRGAQLLAMVPRARARHGQRRAVLRLAPGRRAHGAAGAGADSVVGLAGELRRLRVHRRRVGGGLVPARIAIAPPTTPTSMPRSWRGSRRMTRDNAARARGRARRGRRCFRSPNLYAICAMYFALGYGLYFYFTWLPTYLHARAAGSRWSTGGFFSALPFLLAGAANLAGGWYTDHLARTRGLRTARCTLGVAVVRHVRGAAARVDGRCRRRSLKARAARAGAGVGRLRAERVLGGVPRRRCHACRRGDGVHEHERQPRRTDRAARGRR